MKKIGMDVPKEERDVNLCYWWEDLSDVVFYLLG